MVDTSSSKPPSERSVIATFGSASFLNDMGSDIVFSIWPSFVYLLMGVNPFFLGIIDGVGNCVVNISKGASGFASDAVQKRKVFIWTGYLAGAFSRFFYGLAPTWEWLLPARILDRAGKVRGSPRDALIADVSSMETRGRNFGILRALDNLGAVAGIIITIAFVTFALPFLNSQFGFTDLLSIRFLFMAAALPTIIGALLVLVKIKDYRKKPGKPKFSLDGFSRSLVLFIVISFIFSTAFFSYSFIVIYASLFFVFPVINPLLDVTIGYLIFTLAAALLSAPLGKLSDHIGRRGTLLVGYGFFALMCLLFILLPNIWTILIALICYGASIGAAVPAQKSLVAELAPTDLRASFLGVYQLVTGFAALFASVLAGLLWVLFLPQTPFLVALGLTILAALLLPFVKEQKTI